jgi:Secretion system C-terminal sorting domain
MGWTENGFRLLMRAPQKCSEHAGLERLPMQTEGIMAKKIIRLPGHMSMVLLRLIGAAVTFLFTFFVYASGQIIQTTSKGLAKADSTIVVPDYGIAPLYGIIVWYGPASAQFSVKGTIRSQADNAAIENVKVFLKDTTTKQVVDSALTAADGSFSMTFIQSPVFHTWIFEAQDIDGAQNGSFQNKDTLISIPAVGGLADTATIELYLQKLSQAVNPVGPGASPAGMSMRAWRSANGTIEMRYALPAGAQTRMALYDATGRQIKEIFDRSQSAGEHEARLETSGLSAGIYFLKLQTGTHAAITRISIER